MTDDRARTRLLRGDPAPSFRAPVVDGNPHYMFDTIAGRHVLLLFFDTARRDALRAALTTVAANRALFDDRDACFFGVTLDPGDAAERRIAQSLPGIRFVLDQDRAVSIAYGALPAEAIDGAHHEPHWLLLDPALQVLAGFPLDQGVEAVRALRSAIADRSPDGWAPVLQIPRVFEPELCRALIARYQTAGGTDSGFMREIDGKTAVVVDHTHKRRSDWVIDDDALRQALAARIHRRLAPKIQQAFQFGATRMERYLVACYDSAQGGYFRRHRDNTTKGTAHRRFAVTINLNAGDYDGGELLFPEYGARTYRPPTGGAIVFSCSLLHEATPVTAGRRYAFLPFLYDEPAARQREANNVFLAEGIQRYRA